MVTKTKHPISEIKSNWQPKWFVKDEHDCHCGITLDDHCFVVLRQDWDGNWTPSNHITNAVVMFLGELANNNH